MLIGVGAAFDHSRFRTAQLPHYLRFYDSERRHGRARLQHEPGCETVNNVFVNYT